MAEQHCIYSDREDALVAYLYDDIDADARVAFETHIATCEPCRTELAELRGVRSTLTHWATPDSDRVRRPSFVVDMQSARADRESRWWHHVPVWAQVAAAMLVLGVSASVAKLDVRYDRTNGLDITTGWARRAPVATAPASAAPWRAEIEALQSRLRSEIHAQSATVAASAASAPASAGMSDAEVGRRVRVLLDDSERRQKKELALQILQLQKDMNIQRQADLTRIYQNIGLIQTNTSSELANQRNYVRMAVSQRQ